MQLKTVSQKGFFPCKQFDSNVDLHAVEKILHKFFIYPPLLL